MAALLPLCLRQLSCPVPLAPLLGDAAYDVVCDLSSSRLHFDGHAANRWLPASPAEGCHAFAAFASPLPTRCELGARCAACEAPPSHISATVRLEGGSCAPCGCALLTSWTVRQAVLLCAGLIFIAFTLASGETREPRTFVADCAKQAGQQAIGGVLLLLVGERLSSRGGADALAWYAAQYPFEVLLTTLLTRVLKEASSRCIGRAYRRTRARWLRPCLHYGQYGPEPRSFRASWCCVQMAHAVLLVGGGARLGSVGIILALVALPGLWSPVRLLAELWYHSGLSCTQRTIAALYVIPVLGDAVQLVVIDRIQRFRPSHAEEAALHPEPTTSSSPTTEL
ncbi:hypothetical protein AB1Y20_017261 [Prymnesium parvum]|uniref:Transmembrane protein 147 n=1 Tax=Prymnesium parvum TaxID=97485 RepID=A0AB34JLY7_PRYPA